MSVGRICVRDVYTADPWETAADAAERMRSQNVGTLVVLDEAKRPVGIITDRDLALRVVAEDLTPSHVHISQLLNNLPKTVREDAPIESALAVMRSGPYRRLPVIDAQGRLVGLLSLDDVLELLAEEFQEIKGLLAGAQPRRSVGSFG